MKKKDIQFQISCSPDPFNAYFDPDKLDKILYNLLSNASKYNRAGGLVSVELSENEDRTARLVAPAYQQKPRRTFSNAFMKEITGSSRLLEPASVCHWFAIW